MNRRLVAVCVCASGFAFGGETVERRVCRPYDAVHAVSFEVLRDKEMSGGDVMRMMRGFF